MFRSILSFLGSLALYLIIGGTVIAGFYNPKFFIIPGSIIRLAGAVVITGNIVIGRRLRRAQDEYYKLQREFGYDAKNQCPHRLFTISQKDIGVFTMTDKWCRVCGKHLGPAKLNKSIFGKKWE